jgi:hypothetical protein
MKHEGLASFPHILTEADVLFHCYGIAYEAAKEPVSAPVAIPVATSEPTPEPVVVSAPIATPEPSPEPVVSEPEPVATSTSLTLEETVAKLMSENSKAALVTKAEQAGIDTSGTKNEVATRLASHLIGV